jgi:hypothetical protein
MAYDYTLSFLARHTEDVDMIEECYRTRKSFQKVFDYPAEVTVERKTISNVLRSLAVNYPEQYLHVRRTIRTRIDPLDNGKWQLTVYAMAPGEKVEGRPPGVTTKTSWIGTSERMAVIDSEYAFPDVIEDEPTWMRLMEQVLHCDKTVKRITAEFAGDLDMPAMEAIFSGEQHKPEDRWRASANGPTTLVLERD